MVSRKYSKRKYRKGINLERSESKKASYATVYIICEGEKTEIYYIKAIIEHYRINTANVVILPSKGSAPISVVNHAIELAKKTADIDYMVCVIDRDDHESFERAKKTLEDYIPSDQDKSTPEFKLISSNPCIEVWFGLHISYTTKPHRSNKSKSAA